MAEHRLLLTPSADIAIRALRGKAAAVGALGTRIEGAGLSRRCYRLLAEGGSWSLYCCKHLYGRWRVVSPFEPEIVWVVAAGEHDGPQFYRQLSEELDIAGVGHGREQKPAVVVTRGGPRSALGAHDETTAHIPFPTLMTTTWPRFGAKLGLAFGRQVLGEEWLSTSDAEHLRDVLWGRETELGAAVCSGSGAAA